MSPRFPGAPAEAMGHYTEMQSTVLSHPGSPTAMEGLGPVSHQHAETALPGEQEPGSHFDNAFFDPDEISFDNLPTHLANVDWETFDKTYRTCHEQGADDSFGRSKLPHTHNARGYGNIQRLTTAHGDETQFTELFERAVETRNKGQLNADIWESLIHSPIPPSINSVLEQSHIVDHNNTPKVQHIEQATVHHGVGSSNAQDHEQRDELPGYSNPSAQLHDVSVESIGIGSSNVEAHTDTDHASTVGTSGAHHDVEMIESYTSESLDAGTPVAQAYVQVVQEPAKKTTPPFAKQSDGGRRRNGNQGQNCARSEPIHSDLSGEKDETSEAHSSSQKNSGDSTPPEVNIEDVIDPALTAPFQNFAPNSEFANVTSHLAHNAEKAYRTPADSQEAQLAYHSGSQGVTTSSMQDMSLPRSNGSAVLDYPTNNQSHRPPTVEQSQHRYSSFAAAPNQVDQSQEHPAQDISNEQQQIQPRPVSSERSAQSQAPGGSHAAQSGASPVPAAASDNPHNFQAPRALSEQALSKQSSPGSAADSRKKLSAVDRLFPQIHTIPGLPSSHDLMNPDWSRLGIETKFASLEEANKALETRKGPPRDPHLVVSQAQKLAIVNAFLRAMLNLEGVDDQQKTIVVWKNRMRREPLKIEGACWNTLEAIIRYHKTEPLPNPPPPKKKGEKKERQEDEETEKTKDPAKTGALLSFPDRIAAIVRIFHVSKSTCKRMLDFHCKYISEFVDTPLQCLARCRSNIIVNQGKGGDIRAGKAAKAKEKAEAEVEAEAEAPGGDDSADEADEADEAGDDARDLEEPLEKTVARRDQNNSGQPGPLPGSAARGQSSYAPSGRHSQSYYMQGMNNTGHSQVMTNNGHVQGMNNAGYSQVMDNNRHVQGMNYTGHSQVMDNNGHIQGMNHNAQRQGVQGVLNTGYSNAMNNNGLHYVGQHPGVSNTGQIQPTINTGHFLPTDSTGGQSSMNSMVGMFPDPALNAPRPSNGSHSGYEQFGISPEFTAIAAPNSQAALLNPYTWASLALEMPPPPPQHPPQLPTHHQPTSTPTSMTGPNPVVSRNTGSNSGLPSIKEKRGRKRSSTETGAAEACPPTKRRR